MIKTLKKFYLLMILTVFCILLCPVQIKAAEEIIPEAVLCGVGGRKSAEGIIKVGSEYETYDVRNLKSDKEVKAVIKNNEILIHAKKAGKYRISFDLYTYAEEKPKHCNVTVYAEEGFDNTSILTSVLKTVSFNGKKVRYEPYLDFYYGSICTELTSANVKFELFKGYKIKKISVVTTDQKGKKHTKTKKKSNSMKINFTTSSSESMDDPNRESDNNSWIKQSSACTMVYIEFESIYQNSNVPDSVGIELDIYTPVARWYKSEY